MRILLAEKPRANALYLALLLWAVCLAAKGTLVAEAGQPAPLRLTLSQALDQALAGSEAVREQARSEERQRLNELSKENAKQPRWQFTASTRFDSEWRSGATATMSWKLSEHASLRLNVPLGTPLSPSSGKSLVLDWSPPLWPKEDQDLRVETEARQKHLAQLALQEQASAAALEVIDSFHRVQAGIEQVDLARRALRLAEGRLEYAQTSYERGLISFSAWQAERNSHQQAQTALQRAEAELERASERFMRWLGEAGNAFFSDGIESIPILEDDLDWDASIRKITETLDVPVPYSARERRLFSGPQLQGPVWEERLLTHSVTYQRAVIAELQTRAELAAVETGNLPSVSAGANLSSDLVVTRPQWFVGLSAVWDLNPNTLVERRRAELAWEEAEESLQAARISALEAGRSAWLAVSEAIYALELAQAAVEEAEQAAAIVKRRVAAGLAPLIEEGQALLEVDRQRLQYAEAEADLWLAWGRLAERLGLTLRRVE